MYSQKEMGYFKNPTNVGGMENPNGIGHVGNSVSDNMMELYITVKDGSLTEVKLRTPGGAE